MKMLLYLCLLILTLGGWSCQQETADRDKAAADPATQAMAAFRAGQYEKATELYRAALSKDPKSAENYNYLGMAYRFQNQKQPSAELRRLEIEAFTKSTEVRPDFAVALVNLGSSYYYSGNKEKAAEHFRRVLQIMPAHPQADKLKEMITEAEAGQGQTTTPD